MQPVKTTFLKSGNRIRIDSGSSEQFDALPLGTYTVNIDPMSGPYLTQVEDLTLGIDKVYGDSDQKVEKIFTAYKHQAQHGKSTGILFSGPKGLGKSVQLRSIATRALAEKLPVVRVEKNFNGLAEFLARLGPCVIMFDEFEKVFPITASDQGNQTQFLSLFDGTEAPQQLYILTANDLYRISDFLLDRPGRIRYHIRLNKPTVDEVRQYLTDQVPGAKPGTIAAIANAQLMFPLVYDQLAALALEMRLRGPEATVEEIFQDLNVNSPEMTPLKLKLTTNRGWTIHLDDASYNSDTEKIGAEIDKIVNKNGKEVRSQHYGDVDGDLLSFDFEIDTARVQISADGKTSIPIDAVTYPKDEKAYTRDEHVLKRISNNIKHSGSELMDPDKAHKTLGDLLGEITKISTETKPAYKSGGAHLAF